MLPPKICIECKRPFEGQGDTCTQCLIRPSSTSKELAAERKDERKSVRAKKEFKKRLVKKNKKLTKENTMPKAPVVSEKICIDCKKPYAPTSNVQKRCNKCREIFRQTKWKKYHKSSSAAAPELPTKPIKLVLGDSKKCDLPRLFNDLLEIGCCAIIFGNVKITIEKI